MSIVLYHGTSREAAAEIRESGFVYGPVYFTPDRKVAERYIYNHEDEGALVILKIDCPEEWGLKVDMEEINENPGIHYAIDNGMAVFCPDDIDVAHVEFLDVAIDD